MKLGNQKNLNNSRTMWNCNGCHFGERKIGVIYKLDKVSSVEK